MIFFVPHAGLNAGSFACSQACPGALGASGAEGFTCP